MAREFAKWMQAGLAGILAAGLQVISSGGGLSAKAIGSAVLVAALVRAAGWVTATYGPKPAA